ncbi:hypothetical protein AXG93_1962s1680 [Marchantia polymorpha subsp. ruderalis]|uniref:[phosphatase 2A protein]-leucine-carboxy methyltransferase n=1 Tax=Marchantia polymorpha subsp. ruderalis TaxID=1480154 RepID=A0A176WFC7_MARPO|nr:hypothetical protein AXG93_1962s1680 [Marchantia polymorpha subsp. ruderalis]
MRTLLMQFLDLSTRSDGTRRKQILSIGAGFDTLFFNLHEEGMKPDLFVEIDFQEVTSKKVAIISSHEQLMSTLGPHPIISKGTTAVFLPNKGEIMSEHYKLLPGDLRNLSGLDDVFKQAQLDPRTERLEIFDEFEEWHIMQEHYCVAYGINDPTGMYEAFGFVAK